MLSSREKELLRFSHWTVVYRPGQYSGSMVGLVSIIHYVLEFEGKGDSCVLRGIMCIAQCMYIACSCINFCGSKRKGLGAPYAPGRPPFLTHVRRAVFITT